MGLNSSEDPDENSSSLELVLQAEVRSSIITGTKWRGSIANPGWEVRNTGMAWAWCGCGAKLGGRAMVSRF